MAVEHQRVDGREVAHLIKQTRRVVLQVKVSVPHHDPVQGHGVPPGVHQAERDVVSAHEDGHRIVAGDVDRKRRVPPRRVGEATFFCIANRESTVAKIVFLPERAQRIQRPPQILAAGLELHPLALFTEHRPVHAEFLVGGVREQRHGSHERLGFQVDVVVHEQHVGGPALRSQPHEPAREPAGTAEVPVCHDRKVVGIRLAEVDVVGVVDHQHPHTAAQGVEPPHQSQHLLHRGHHIGVTIEGSDRQCEPHVVRRLGVGAPFDAFDAALPRRSDAHPQRAPTGRSQRAEMHVGDRTRDVGRRDHRVASVRRRDHLDAPLPVRDHARRETVDRGEATPPSGMKHAE